MVGQRERLDETLRELDIVIAMVTDQTVHAYHRFYDETPVTRKYMLIAVKMMDEDAFVITAFYTSRQKKGKVIWQS